MFKESQPSTEDIEKAKEMMSFPQKVASRRRGEMVDSAEKAGRLENLKQMQLDYQENPDKKERTLKGTLKGHIVEIVEEKVLSNINPGDKGSIEHAGHSLEITRNGVFYLLYKGTVDGRQLLSEDAKKLWNGYKSDAENIRRIKKDFESDKKEEEARSRETRDLVQFLLT